MSLGLEPTVWGQYSWETSFSPVFTIDAAGTCASRAADIGGMVDQGEEDGFGGFGW